MLLTPSEITEGSRAGWKTVGVASVEGYTEYLMIEERFLVKRGDKLLLSVRVVARDPNHDTALIQLPFEADSGANRVWVAKSALKENKNETVA